MLRHCVPWPERLLICPASETAHYCSGVGGSAHVARMVGVPEPEGATSRHVPRRLWIALLVGSNLNYRPL